MGFWFGRKSAPELPTCAYGPPAWLRAVEESGFVRSAEGLTVFDKSSGYIAIFVGGAWEVGQVKGEALLIDGEQVVGPRLAAIADVTGGTIVDTEARSAVAAILNALRQHGLIDS